MVIHFTFEEERIKEVKRLHLSTEEKKWNTEFRTIGYFSRAYITMLQIVTDLSMVYRTAETLFFPSAFHSILFSGILPLYWSFLSPLGVFPLCATSKSWIPQEMSLLFIFFLGDFILSHDFKYFNAENHSLLFPADYSTSPDLNIKTLILIWTTQNY